MAMFDSIFAGSKGLASTLLNTMGISGKYLKKTSTYNPRTDKTETSVTERDVVISPLLKYSAYEIANLGVGKDDAKVIGKGVDFSDIENSLDQIVVNGETYTIISHNKVYSGAELACVIMQVRKQEVY